MAFSTLALWANLENPNILTVHFQFADADSAKALEAMNKRIQAEIDDNGVVPGTTEWWIGKDFLLCQLADGAAKDGLARLFLI